MSGGVEWRKGSVRLVGFYGGELVFMLESTKESYTYINGIVTAGGMTYTTDFGSNITVDAKDGTNIARINEMKSGSTIGFGLSAFIGTEYFVLPKLSIGGEFGWGFGLTSTLASTTTLE